MSSDKSSTASGKPNNGEASAPTSPRSYAAVLRGDPEAPTPAVAPSTDMPTMSKASEELIAKAAKIFSETRAVLAKEKDSSPPTASIPGRQEASSSSTSPVAPQPNVSAEASSPATSPIRNPAPASPDLPSPLATLSNAELIVRADRVFKGTRRVLYGVQTESSPTASSAAASDPSSVQEPANDVPSAFWADLEPLEWAVSASKSSKDSLQGASSVEASGSLATPETSSQQPAGSPVKASPKPVEPVNPDSSASIPFDDTEDLHQPESSRNGTTSLDTPPKTPETSGQAAVRVLRDEAIATPDILHQHRRHYIELEGTPEKPILDATEPEASSSSLKDPSWYEKHAFRTPTPSKQAETPDGSATKKARISEEEAKDESAKKDESDAASPSKDSNEVPKPAPSTPRSPAKRPRSPTPERPEERPVLRAVHRRRHVKSAPESTVAPITRQQRMMHTRHRCPDCDQSCRYVEPVNPLPNSDDNMTPPTTPRSSSPQSSRASTPNNFEPMDDMDFEGPAEDAASDVARDATPQPDVQGAGLPDDFEFPAFEPYSPSPSPVRRSASPNDRSITPMSTAAGSEVSIASSSRPASPIRDLFCPRCHRDCNCPHIENPNADFAPAPVRRPRGPRRITTEEAWARLGHIEDIIGVDLPAPEPVIMDTPFMIVDNGPLTADRQTQTIRRPTFQLVLYDTGIVVLRGTFTGVSLNSKLLALAAKQPTVIFNDPEDPAEQIAAGFNHIVIRTQLGRVFTLGRGNEGQLGATKYPRRCRQAAAALNMASMRRLPPGNDEVVFTDIRASGNVTRAKAKDGPWYVCGEGHKALLTVAQRRGRGGRRL